MSFISSTALSFGRSSCSGVEDVLAKKLLHNAQEGMFAGGNAALLFAIILGFPRHKTIISLKGSSPAGSRELNAVCCCPRVVLQLVS